MADRRHLLITGASSGIGAALVRHALAQGWRVSGIARRADRLKEVADLEVKTLAGVFKWYVADVGDLTSLYKRRLRKRASTVDPSMVWWQMPGGVSMVNYWN